MIRNVFLFNLTSFDALPGSERWYWNIHAPQAVRIYGPWLSRYESYRAVPLGDAASRLGFYNYRLSEMWFREFEPLPGVGGFSWYESHDRDWGHTRPDHYGTRWTANPDGPGHQPVQLFIPALPTEDLLGAETPLGAPCFRWVMVHRYPPEVAEAAGEAWFLDTLLPELAELPGITRLFSHRALEMPEEMLQAISPEHPHQYPWRRLTEIWFADLELWEAAVESPLTPPPWGGVDGFPFLRPYVDCVGTMVLERPDWTLADLRPYP